MASRIRWVRAAATSGLRLPSIRTPRSCRRVVTSLACRSSGCATRRPLPVANRPMINSRASIFFGSTTVCFRRAQFVGSSEAPLSLPSFVMLPQTCIDFQLAKIPPLGHPHTELAVACALFLPTATSDLRLAVSTNHPPGPRGSPIPRAQRPFRLPARHWTRCGRLLPGRWRTGWDSPASAPHRPTPASQQRPAERSREAPAEQQRGRVLDEAENPQIAMTMGSTRRRGCRTSLPYGHNTRGPGLSSGASRLLCTRQDSNLQPSDP